MSERSRSGLTPDEQRVADKLIDAWNAFMALDASISPKEQEAFMDAIHMAQLVLMNRVMARVYPDYWNRP